MFSKCLPLSTASFAAESQTLWQIGASDNDNREFALAPNHYGNFGDDGFFVVGQSDPQRDWPYVHPGPHDGWAGGRPHTFTVVFGLKVAPTDGECTLHCDLLDTHSQAPPELRIVVNGQEFSQSLPAGAGDASVFGQPSQGREHRFAVTFPARLLRADTNELAITTRSGSWMLYDSLSLEAPTGLELDQISGTVVGAINSPPVLVERNGKLSQIVRVALRHYGDPTPARLQIEGMEPKSLTLDATQQTVEVTVPAVDQPTEIEVRVDLPGKESTAQTITLRPVRKWVVYLLPHSHVDIGYTHVQTDVEQAQWKYLELAIDTARKSAKYPWAHVSSGTSRSSGPWTATCSKPVQRNVSSSSTRFRRVKSVCRRSMATN